MNMQVQDEEYFNTVHLLRSVLSENSNLSPNDSQVLDLNSKDNTSVLTVAKTQNKYIQQLENEVHFLREELAAIKRNVQEVIVENDNLRHDVAKSYALSVKNQLDEVDNDEQAKNAGKQTSDLFSNAEGEIWGKWQAEMERMRSLYQTVAKRLEDQANHFRAELLKKKEEIDDLKAQLREYKSDSFVQHGKQVVSPPLCVICADNEAAFIPATNENNDIHKMANKNEELAHALADARRNLKEAEAREEDSHEQVKKSVLLVEQVQFEKTELQAENLHLKQNIKREENRMKDIMNEYKETLTKERNAIADEWNRRLVQVQEKIVKMNEEQVELESKYEKSEREKREVQQALVDARQQLEGLQQEMTKAQHAARQEIAELHMQRERANDELRMVTNDRNQLSNVHRQQMEAAQFKIEISERKLAATDRKLTESQDQCLLLSRSVTELEMQASVAILSKRSMEKSRTDDVKSLSQQAELREEQLMSHIKNLEAQHAKKLSDMDEIISSQASLIEKLKEECKILTEQLEHVSHLAWDEKCKLLDEKAKLASGLQASLDRLETCDAVRLQHIEDEAKLRHLLVNSEEISKKNSNQLYELIQKQVLMDQERQHLKDEVTFLHNELMKLSRYKDRRSFS